MGILSGKPKAPPVSTTQPLPAAIVSTTPITDPDQTADEIAAEARTESLLRRSRSRFGTILTGFKGFLSPNEGSATTSRKTLLGE